jgi:hypothetical protein
VPSPNATTTASLKTGNLVSQAAVVVGTISHTYRGQMVYFKSERLVDVLNHGSSGDQPELSPDIIQLHHTQICSVEGDTCASSRRCLIPKASVLFVGEVVPGLNPLAIIDKPHVHVRKASTDVEIYLASFKVAGRIHLELWQRLIGALNDPRSFIPVTAATICGPNSWCAEFEFVAINRRQIACMALAE